MRFFLEVRPERSTLEIPWRLLRPLGWWCHHLYSRSDGRLLGQILFCRIASFLATCRTNGYLLLHDKHGRVWPNQNNRSQPTVTLS
jgi:hypothetical protein